MRRVHRLSISILMICAALVLAACQDREAQAEQHYQRALELLEAGDTERARVEFLNVFDNNGFHREARADFAAMLRETDQTGDSYSQYLRLIEQYPDDIEARIALAEMAIEFQNWEEAQRHGPRAIELAPADPRVEVIRLSLAYADTVEAEDAPARRAVFDQVAALLETEPDNFQLLRIQADHRLLEGDLEGGLVALDAALAREPDTLFLYRTKLAVLAELNRPDEIETLLLDMVVRFPEDEDLPRTVLRFYLSRGQVDAARAFLQDQADRAETAEDRASAQSTLVQLVLQTEGPDAALAELDAIIAAGSAAGAEEGAEDAAQDGGGGVALFRAQRAGIWFDLGRTEEALAEIEDVLAGELTLTERGRIRVGLARMLLASGNPVGARAQVEGVLEAESGQVDALKMLAAWLIEDDEADRAIARLRTVLDSTPDDVEALTLMARAHQRNGDRSLMREFLLAAVEASNSAPEESLRYAAALIEEERFLAAEEVLLDALRLAPRNLELTARLGETYIAMEDWPRAGQVERSLRENEDPSWQRVADGLQAARLAAQGRMEDAVAFLESLAIEGEATDVRTQIAVIRARLANGDSEGALSFAETLVAEAPDVLAYRFALAAVQSATGALEAAETSFRALTVEHPEIQQGWIGLIRALNAQGRTEAAEEVLNAALEALPEALELLWAQASFRERAGDYEGAIAIYELMYERAPNSDVVANNLASLISTYRDDEESLVRAWAIARRLRGTEIPPFQDTYGWIAYRRGDYEAALAHLEPAAAALPGDPLVQFHLGMTYLAVEEVDAARAQLERALEIAGPDDPRAQFVQARAALDEIAARAAEDAAEAEAETGAETEGEAAGD